MLNDEEQAWLVRQVMATAELLGQALTPHAAALMAEDLSGYPRPALSRALSRVRKLHTGRLTTKAILDRVDEVMGRLAPNEAWALALKASDERETVIWSQEAENAWSVAAPLVAGGDKIGARMAFLSAYERLVMTARENQQPPCMVVSLGWDEALRRKAIEQALQLGHISHEQASDIVPLLPPPTFSPLALIGGKLEISSEASTEVRARLMLLRDELASRRRKPTVAMVMARAERMRMSRLKRAANAAVTAATKKGAVTP